MKKNSKKILSLLLAMLMALSLCACGRQDADSSASDPAGEEAVANEDASYNWTFTTALVDDHPLSQGMLKFAELLSEESGGRITAEVYTGGSLGGDVDLMEQLAAGLIDAHSTTTTFAANYVPSIGVFDLPYIFKDEEHLGAVAQSDIFQAEMDKLDGTGIKVLCDLAFGYRNVTANKEIHVPDDMKSVKIRLVESDVMTKMFSAVGAIPTVMAFSELYTALQNGTVDAQENPTFTIYLSNFDEVQDYVILTQHCYNIGAIYFSEAVFNSLSQEDQELVMKCAQEAREWQYAYAKQIEADSLEALKTGGNTTVIELTAEEKEQWISAMTTIYPDFYDLCGEDLINQIINFEY